MNNIIIAVFIIAEYLIIRQKLLKYLLLSITLIIKNSSLPEFDNRQRTVSMDYKDYFILNVRVAVYDCSSAFSGLLYGTLLTARTSHAPFFVSLIIPIPLLSVLIVCAKAFFSFE